MQKRQETAGRVPALLTAQQVQELLGVDASTVYRMAADGRLPAVKIGRQWRFRSERISALLDADHVAPEAGEPPATPDADAGEPAAPAAVLRPEIASSVIEAAADLLGVMMVVTDMQGRPVTPVANPCPRFVAHAHDPDVVSACAEEWHELAQDLDFEPRFAQGHLGFECARAFLRSGSSLVGMVLVGGIAPRGEQPADDLFWLDDARRAQVLAALRKVAVSLSRAATLPAPQDPRDRPSVAGPDH